MYHSEIRISLRVEDGALLHERLKFPQLCHAQLGLQLPAYADAASMEAWLLCLSMKEVKTFGPYGFSQAMMDTVLDHATQLWGPHGLPCRELVPFAGGLRSRFLSALFLLRQ